MHVFYSITVLQYFCSTSLSWHELQQASYQKVRVLL